MMSVTAGNVLGLCGGGWLTQAFGWRAMFLAAGLPGLMLAPVVLLVLREPRTAGKVQAAREPWGATFAALAGKPAYLLGLAGMALFFAVAYGPMSFVVPFLVRVHHLSIGRAGALYGLCTAVGGLVGNLAGGVLTDRLSARDIRWLCWIPAAGVAAICVLYQGAFLAGSLGGLIAFLLCGGVFSAAAYPPMYALLHAVCGSPRRVTALALALFVANLLGFGLGPLSVGALSDLLAPGRGAGEALRWALVAISAVLLPASLLFLGAAARVRGDIEA